MKVFVVGGGTGGHLFPAIALGEELLNRGYDVHLVTDTRCKNYLPSEGGRLKTHIFHLGFMRRGVVSKILLSARMIMAISRSIALLICYRPQVVVGFGGYTAFPMMLASRLLHIPIILHEQNCFLGKVNDMFARNAAKIALNFAETVNLPTSLEKKVIVTGNPVRGELRRGGRPKTKTFSKNTINILVTGGSQSALVFSELVPEAIKIIHAKDPKLKISITQQAAAETCEHLRAVYKTVTNKIDVEPFFHDMRERYLDSDLVICRSGASTIAELIYLGKPAIMIPYPSAAEDHQTFNAKALEAKGGGWMMPQAGLTSEILADKILHIAKNPRQLSVASEHLINLYMPSEQILADVVDEIIKN